MEIGSRNFDGTLKAIKKLPINKHFYFSNGYRFSYLDNIPIKRGLNLRSADDILRWKGDNIRTIRLTDNYYNNVKSMLEKKPFFEVITQNANELSQNTGFMETKKVLGDVTTVTSYDANGIRWMKLRSKKNKDGSYTVERLGYNDKGTNPIPIRNWQAAKPCDFTYEFIV